MAQTIGFVGYGNINSILAQHAVNAGYRVILSNSRGPATLSDAVAKLGPHARAATVEEVVRESDIVSVSIQFGLIDKLPVDSFAGKIVIDSMNYYPQRDGRFEDLESRATTESLLVQDRLKGSRVVKAFNTIDQFHLQFGARPAGDASRWALPIAADDAEAKAAVVKFVDAIGFDTADTGSLADSWRFQPNTPAYSRPYIGEFPESEDADELYEWVKNDHIRVVKVADVLGLVAAATTAVPVGGVTILPPAYAILLGDIFKPVGNALEAKS